VLRPRGKTYSPFSGRRGLRRFGMTAGDMRRLAEAIEVKDATADFMRSKHPGIEVVYGDREDHVEKRFKFLRRRRRGF
jgi:hypothetical protein